MILARFVIGGIDEDSAEFAQHGLSNVFSEHRNVCKDGFGNLSDIEAGECLEEFILSRK